MLQLTPIQVQNLVTKAFILEAITDKPGCTTRYHDLPGKPLTDFLLAGINVSESFKKFAEAYANDYHTPIFSYNADALLASNLHKSHKYINFGLLEIMFPTVAARLSDNNPDTVIDTLLELIRKSGNEDVSAVLHTRDIAWSTSTNTIKTDFKYEKYKSLSSVWDFYETIYNDFDPTTSNHQWTAEFKKGLPLLRNFFEAYTDSGEVVYTTKIVFEKERTAHPNISVGIVADMCAAAIFLWLSFHESACAHPPKTLNAED